MINHHCISVCSFKNVVLKYIGAHDTIVDVFLSSFTFVDFPSCFKQLFSVLWWFLQNLSDLTHFKVIFLKHFVLEAQTVLLLSSSLLSVVLWWVCGFLIWKYAEQKDELFAWITLINKYCLKMIYVFTILL